MIVGLAIDRLPSPARVILTTPLPPSERRDLWGAGTVYGRTLTYPLRFHTCGEREGDTTGMALGTQAQAFLQKNRSK